jgi:hypothetical protein
VVKAAPAKAPPNTWASLIFQLYLAGVCGFSLIIGTFSAGGLLTGAFDMVFPQPIMVSETLWNDAAKANEPRPVTDIEKERAQQAQSQAFNTKREMAKGGIYLLLAGLIFGFHWRLFKARKE